MLNAADPRLIRKSVLMFPFRGKSSAEKSQSQTDAATAPGAGAQVQYPPPAPAKANTAAASYPPAAYAADGNASGATTSSAYPAAATSGPQEPSADVVVQLGQDKPGDNRYSGGYNTQYQATRAHPLEQDAGITRFKFYFHCSRCT